MEPNGKSGRGIGFAFRALRHRNYRLFFAGQALSLIGTWITRVAIGWLVYRLTDSAFMLGLVSFVGMAPTFLVTPLGGIAADRWNRHRVLVITQVVLMLTSLLLAYFAISGTITISHIVVLSAMQGLCNAFDIPTRQAFVVDLVEGRADLSSAIAMNSMIFNSARLIGPSIAGVLIAIFGEGLCFFIDGVSFLAVISALLAMRIATAAPRKANAHVVHELRVGLGAAFGFPPIRAILLLMAMTSLMGMPYSVLMPVFADRVLHGDAMTLGFLMAASGVGALCGALMLAMRESVLGLGRLIAGGAIVFGVTLAAFGLSRSLWLSLPLLIGAGFAMMVQNAASNTIVQTIVDDDKRGRVMGFFAMAFMGTMPFGSLIAGAMARHIGAPATVMIGGGVCSLAGLWFAWMLPGIRKLVRPIYVSHGILPPLPEGVGSTAQMLPSADA
ncbi:MAG: MFS transporter [Phycisphaerales bacterium]|nr:MFS transporter [Phycisphaerales bacterium]MCB9856981.1 MFS transporter [Phycisphaerales bacterium]MCB9861892.1 MFS transporter [Phycisphaerales bacterium]